MVLNLTANINTMWKLRVSMRILPYGNSANVAAANRAKVYYTIYIHTYFLMQVVFVIIERVARDRRRMWLDGINMHVVVRKASLDWNLAVLSIRIRRYLGLILNHFIHWCELWRPSIAFRREWYFAIYLPPDFGWFWWIHASAIRSSIPRARETNETQYSIKVYVVLLCVRLYAAFQFIFCNFNPFPSRILFADHILSVCLLGIVEACAK